MRPNAAFAPVPSGWKSLYDTIMPNQPPPRTHIAILPAVLLLAGTLGSCSGGDDSYPSLASRPAERLNDGAPPAAPDSHDLASPVPAAPSAELAARLDQLVQQAQAAHRDFADKRGDAEALVSAAGAAPAGSEAWARATQVLSGIESARSLTAQPLADLDRIEIDDRLAHRARAGPDGNLPSRPDAIAIAQARTTVAALVAQEDEVLAKLDGRLAR